MTHDLAWFTARIGKDVIRTYNGNDTIVSILKGEKADKYFFELQDEGFTFKDTVQTIAEADTVEIDTWNDLEKHMDDKKSNIRIHIGDVGCESCSA